MVYLTDLGTGIRDITMCPFFLNKHFASVWLGYHENPRITGVEMAVQRGVGCVWGLGGFAGIRDMGR